MSDEEKRKDRELQIKIAQLNAKLQVAITWSLGLFATTIALWIFGYQILKENESVSELAWGLAIFTIVIAIVWIRKAKRISREFGDLKP
jgi:FtsH-binding integral membrane protein